MGALVAFYFENYLFGIVLILLTSLLLLYGAKKPGSIKVFIDGTGIHTDTAAYKFKELRSFSLVEDKKERTLIIETKRLVAPLIHFPLGKMQGSIVRDHLRKHVVEKEYERTLADSFLDSVGF